MTITLNLQMIAQLVGIGCALVLLVLIIKPLAAVCWFLLRVFWDQKCTVGVVLLLLGAAHGLVYGFYPSCYFKDSVLFFFLAMFTVVTLVMGLVGILDETRVTID